MLVFIVGYMGAGKSSVGAALAKALNFRFVDTDDWIEARCCKTITQIFNDLGEKEFRGMEKETRLGNSPPMEAISRTTSVSKSRPITTKLTAPIAAREDGN